MTASISVVRVSPGSIYLVYIVIVNVLEACATQNASSKLRDASDEYNS